MRWLWRLVPVLCLLVLAGALHAETMIERMVSPGPLSPGHTRLDTRCNACHASFKRATQPAQCLACHTGIARDRATHTRFHGMVTESRTEQCRECHAEHKSKTQSLAQLDIKAFNHTTESIYRLTGAHVRTRCVACHAGLLHYRQAPQACAACHARVDIHRGRLGPQCQSCHNTARWKEVLPFDHDHTRYPLTGAHRTTACVGCHVGEQWRGVSTECVSCHVKKDVHRGADGPKCAQCHLTTRWRPIVFDHDTVKAFPLREAHRTVACIGCHALTVRPAKAPVACAGCHTKDDVHRGADGPKCESCHSQTTWKVDKFDHAKTTFALLGLHKRVTCVACHPRSVDKVKVGTRCIDCHKKDDVHHDALGPMCERCHNANGFRIPGVERIHTPWRSRMVHDFPRSGLSN